MAQERAGLSAMPGVEGERMNKIFEEIYSCKVVKFPAGEWIDVPVEEESK